MGANRRRAKRLAVRLRGCLDLRREEDLIERALDAAETRGMERAADEAELERMKSRPVEQEHARLDAMWQELVRQHEESKRRALKAEAEVADLRQKIGDEMADAAAATVALREVQAQAAAMRAALEALVAAYSVRLSAKGHANWHPDGDQRVHHSAWIAAFAALSSDAERDLLRVVEAAKALLADIDSGESETFFEEESREMRNALAAWEKRHG